ncbi:MAG: AMP-binding protein, partial [Caldilineaceae bacterium]|nr:AMP-binding protein [Caldilineaceae bacterium]
MNLHDLFAIPRWRTPGKIALEFEGDGRAATLTYAQLYAAVDRLAAGLQAWGLRKGERVAFYCNSRPEFV